MGLSITTRVKNMVTLVIATSSSNWGALTPPSTLLQVPSRGMKNRHRDQKRPQTLKSSLNLYIPTLEATIQWRSPLPPIKTLIKPLLSSHNTRFAFQGRCRRPIRHDNRRVGREPCQPALYSLRFFLNSWECVGPHGP